MSLSALEETNEVVIWRAVPAPANESGGPEGAWGLVAGVADEDPDIYIEITAADSPRRVAEFLASAAQSEASDRRWAGAMGDVERAHGRVRDRHDGPLPDMIRVAQLAEHLGKIASEFSDPARVSDRKERADRVYDELADLAACAIAWMDSNGGSARGD